MLVGIFKAGSSQSDSSNMSASAGSSMVVLSTLISSQNSIFCISETEEIWYSPEAPGAVELPQAAKVASGATASNIDRNCVFRVFPPHRKTARRVQSRDLHANHIL